MLKVCSRCNAEKPLSAFHRQAKKYSHLHAVPPEMVGKPYGNGYHARCKDCRKATRAQTPSEHGAGLRDQKLRTAYGITIADYGRMLAKQSGGCAICGCPPEHNTHGVLFIDHCHTTGAIRGLLCAGCNSALGHLKDRPELCLRAADYLKNFGY